MPVLHDPAVRSRMETRLKALRADSPRQWGSMSAPQMLWHLNQYLGFALGDAVPEPGKFPIPKAIMRFFLLYAPWPKGAPTHKQAIARTEYDFETERARCLTLIDRFVSRPMDAKWPDDPIFGFTTGKSISQLQAKHLDHHFRQFGA
jgi:hypothetical protein